MNTSIQHWLITAEKRLRPISDSANLDAQVLLAAQLAQSRTWVLAHPDHPLTPADLHRLDSSLIQLENATPLPYITGKSYFYGLEFHVTPDVLIPRPETELLVEHALQWTLTHPSPLILDLGTGSGCIAVTLAVHLPACRITAADRSPAALRIARHNADYHNVTPRVDFILSDGCSAISPQYPLFCANLPYIPSAELHRLPVALHEPIMALDGGGDGLELIRQVLSESPRVTTKDACLLFEIEANQGDAAYQHAKMIYPQAVIAIHQDLAGKDRLLKIERHG